jgi:uncharacterized protein YdhG (YjbR/CyaY superfamily)
MKSLATDVNAYLLEVPDDRRAALEHLRRVCLEVLDGYEEDIRYGMPCYTRPGAEEAEIGFAFASQKNHISLYGLTQDVIQANKPLLVGASLAKGCVRYAKPERMDIGVVKKMLLEMHALKDKRGEP